MLSNGVEPRVPTSAQETLQTHGSKVLREKGKMDAAQRRPLTAGSGILTGTWPSAHRGRVELSHDYSDAVYSLLPTLTLAPG